MLREHNIAQESRTDDDLIIGRLQRQLMATKTAYKVHMISLSTFHETLSHRLSQAFTRKYQMLRSNMRQRELTQRLLEHRLDTREETLLHLQDNHKLELSALKKTLKDIYESLITSTSAAATTSAPLPSVPTAPTATAANHPLRQSKQTANLSLEEQSLKTILYRLTGIGSLSSNQITISDKLTHLSQQMTQLSSLAENANERREGLEEKKMALEYENERLVEENKILLKSISDLREILETDQTSASTLPLTGVGGGSSAGGGGTNAVYQKKQQQLKQQTKAIALKVFHLNDEMKGLKGLTIKQKREIALLTQEKKYLQSILSRVEADLHLLEEGRGQAYRPSVLMAGGGRGGGVGGAGDEEDEDPLIAEFIKLREDLFSYPATDEDDPQSHSQPQSSSQSQPPQQKKKTSPIREGLRLSVKTTADDEDEDGTNHGSRGAISKEEMMTKLEHTTAEMLSSKKDLQTSQRQLDSLHQKIQELQEVLTDQEEALAYYERMAVSEGLPTLQGRSSTGGGQRGQGYNSNTTIPRGKEWRMMREEQEKLQEAASATIGSMRSLLEEKNIEIERLPLPSSDLFPLLPWFLITSLLLSFLRLLPIYLRLQSKITSLLEGNVHSSGNLRKPISSAADRRAEELLKRLEDEDRYRNGRRPSDDPRNMADKSLVQRLMDQIDTADELLQEKIRSINQYEQKIAMLSNQKEKAEQRLVSFVLFLACY
jgi:hypothetical protein